MFSLQTIFGSGKQFYTYLDEAAQAAADSAKALHAMMREADRQPALDAFKLARLGFTVKEMLGGLDFWIRDGQPVATGPERGAMPAARPAIECAC